MTTASGWRSAKLGEMVTIRTGKLDSNAAVPDGAYPFFTCSQETLRTNTYSFDTECVLLAGNNANGIFPLKYFQGKFDAYQRTYVVTTRRSDRLITRFLYYALRPKLSEFRSISTGAATKFLTLPIINETEIYVPSLPMQRRIASILGAYDDLIENNRRRIAVLEEMARRLFEEWFVQFHFPDHEEQKLVETTQGAPPQGWMYTRLGDIADINTTALRTGGAPTEINYVDISSVTTGQIEKIERIRFDQAPGRARRVVQDGSVIWSTVRPNRRSYALIFDPPEHLIVSTGFAVLDARTVPNPYLYHCVTTDAFVGYLTNNATGSAYPAVTASTFERAPILLPPLQLAILYSDRVEAMLRMAANLRRASKTLGTARDQILPRLMSGALPVTAAQRQLEAAN